MASSSQLYTGVRLRQIAQDEESRPPPVIVVIDNDFLYRQKQAVVMWKRVTWTKTAQGKFEEKDFLPPYKRMLGRRTTHGDVVLRSVIEQLDHSRGLKVVCIAVGNDVTIRLRAVHYVLSELPCNIRWVCNYSYGERLLGFDGKHTVHDLLAQHEETLLLCCSSGNDGGSGGHVEFSLQGKTPIEVAQLSRKEEGCELLFRVAADAQEGARLVVVCSTKDAPAKEYYARIDEDYPVGNRHVVSSARCKVIYYTSGTLVKITLPRPTLSLRVFAYWTGTNTVDLHVWSSSACGNSRPRLSKDPLHDRFLVSAPASCEQTIAIGFVWEGTHKKTNRGPVLFANHRKPDVLAPARCSSIASGVVCAHVATAWEASRDLDARAIKAEFLRSLPFVEACGLPPLSHSLRQYVRLLDPAAQTKYMAKSVKSYSPLSILLAKIYSAFSLAVDLPTAKAIASTTNRINEMQTITQETTTISEATPCAPMNITPCNMKIHAPSTWKATIMTPRAAAARSWQTKSPGNCGWRIPSKKYWQSATAIPTDKFTITEATAAQ